MTYREYMRGDEVTLGVAPTGYRYSTDVNDALPVEPESVATQVYESMALGATVTVLHGRDADGNPDPTRLPAFGRAVRELCGDDVLLEYAAEPDAPLGDFLDALDGEPAPDLATVRLGPTQTGYRRVSETSRRDTEQLVDALTDRGITPNVLVTGGADCHELARLREQAVLPDPPVVTVLLGAPSGAVGTPLSLLSVLDAVPDGAHVFVRATGPNQYPLTTLAFFMGAHPMVGMADNLFFDPDTPVERNAQLVRTVAQLAQRSLRSLADIGAASRRLTLPPAVAEGNDVEA
ncbi:3-keto-5-aminohexanoate cleavage protein [Haloarcula salinisoli]|uniref:3-keto-5-aminohexanoate cleavage protein n=1 Tax=Haloarcula salinisoli TaxID=2487746 RepID=A0A8J8CAG5_9EURY|nr:3-keto-5-aminohexanoate cleavage protein [Halomicroarcula salinisoli]MBX0303073.1 3-keto-5-aminohexanoate cleavage protein [Halomicroarcula salinisoli]